MRSRFRSGVHALTAESRTSSPCSIPIIGVVLVTAPRPNELESARRGAVRTLIVNRDLGALRPGGSLPMHGTCCCGPRARGNHGNLIRIDEQWSSETQIVIETKTLRARRTRISRSARSSSIATRRCGASVCCSSPCRSKSPTLLRFWRSQASRRVSHPGCCGVVQAPSSPGGELPEAVHPTALPPPDLKNLLHVIRCYS